MSSGLSILPANSIQQLPNFDVLNQTGLGKGFSSAFADTFMHAPTLDLYQMGEKLYDEHFSPGKLLTQQEWKESPNFRSGLHYESLADSDGLISQNVAKLAATQFDNEEIRQERLANMKPGLVSGATRFVGGTLGFVLDPVNAATAVLAPEVLGERAPALLAHLTEELEIGARSTNFILGATEGALVTTPQATLSYLNRRELGQNPSAVSALATIGMGAGLGGVLRGLFGVKSIISKNSYRDAMQTAIGQLASGKSVNVDPIIKAGFEAARDNEGLVPRESVEKSKSAALNDIQDIYTKLNAQQAKLSTLDEPSFISKSPEFDTGKKLILKLNKFSDDEQFQSSLPNTPEINRLRPLLKQTPSDLSPSDAQFISDFSDGKEPEMLRVRTAQNQIDLRDIAEKLKDATLDDDERSELEKQKDTLKNELELGKNRLKAITSSKEELRQTAVKNIKRLNEEKEALGHVVKAHQAALDLNNAGISKFTYEDLKNVSDEMASYRSTSAINFPEQEKFDEQFDGLSIDKMPDEKEIDRKLNEFKKDKSINSEFSGELENLEKSHSHLSTLRDGLKKVANCMLENM